MSNLVEIRKKLSTDNQISEFKKVLPANMSFDKFERVAITALSNNPDIAKCELSSVIGSLIKCAQDGLLPDNREASLVKFGNHAQYLPMVAGVIKRMKNSGDVSTVNAFVVYEADDFAYEIIDGEQKLRHVPNVIAEDRGKVKAAYAAVKMKDGSVHTEVMHIKDLEKTRNSSRSKNSPAWRDWTDEMYKKTVIHRAAKRVPSCSEVEEMLKRDLKVIVSGTDQEPKKEESIVDKMNEAIDIEVTPVNVPQEDDILVP